MISIPDIVKHFSYYEKFLKPCKACGTMPKFFYRDTCRPEGIINLDHKCTTPGCNILSRAVDLIYFNTLKTADYAINSIIIDMVNEWNEANKNV